MNSIFFISFLINLSHIVFISCYDAENGHRFVNHHSSMRVHGHSLMHNDGFMHNRTFMHTNHSLIDTNNFQDDPNCYPARLNVSEDCFQTTAQIIESYGYCAENHKLVTEDGYELEFFRLRASCPEGHILLNKPVAILLHGMLGSSSDFVFAGEKRGLAFHLLNNEFDVWLLNLRGNIYGGLHNKPGEFWDFSFHEMGVYDLPAYIDYILDYTKKDKLLYVGFSMGASAAYVLLSVKPNYNDKIERMVNMAPVVFIDHSKSAAWKKMVINVNYWYEETSNSLKAKNNGYPKKPFQIFLAPECLRATKRHHCNRFIRIACANKTLLNYEKKLWDDFYKISPAGGSCKTITHYLQISQSGIFRPYSYNEQINVELYESKEPPPYELENVKIPILLILGGEDKLTVKKNIDNMRKNMISCPSLDVIHVADEEFNHLDFFVAKYIVTLVFEPLTNYLKTGQV